MIPGDERLGNVRAPGKGRRAASRVALGLVAASWIVGVASVAGAETPYDPQRAGNPVRIAAYAANPIGVILDYLIFRPAWWIGHQEPFKTLFGVKD